MHQGSDDITDLTDSAPNENRNGELISGGGWTLWKNVVVIQKERDYSHLWQICDKDQNKAKKSLVEKLLKSSNDQCKLFEGM